MDKTNEFKQFINQSLVFNSVVWALVLVSSYFLVEEPNETFNLVLLTAFFIDFLRLSSTKNKLNKTTVAED